MQLLLKLYKKNIANMVWTDYLNNTAVILLLTVIVWIIYSTKSRKNLPPGPKGLPFFGYLPFLGKNPHLKLTKLKQKYGDIFTIYLAHERVVVLSSFKLIKETFLKQGDVYSERPDSFINSIKFDEETGVSASIGVPRIALRRFTLTTLRNFGMGKASMETKIQDEINCVIDEIKKLNGKSTDLHNLITMSVSNVICALVFGERFEYTNQRFIKLLQLSRKLMNNISINQWYQYLPQFIHDIFKFKDTMYYGKLLYTEILKEVSEYNKKHDDSFINSWRREVEIPNSIIAKTFINSENIKFNSERRLAILATELFNGGSDTVSTTLEWTILYLIKYPKVQKKLLQEIDNVIGKDRTPTMSDQKLMPYTEATIMEVYRFSTIAPFSVPHCSSEDTTLNDYFIPKDTTILPNVWAVHMNPESFPDPERFKPERFLTEDNQIKRIEELIPFSIGKRQCPGEALARMELFLYLTSLFQHFTFTKNESDVDLNPHFSLVLEPMHQKLNAILR